MKPTREVDAFRSQWNREAQRTVQLMESLPADQYDFRGPDPKGRSIGELAWHLAEVDACISYGIAERRFSVTDEVPHLPKRPREIALLAPAFQRVHEQSLEKIKDLDDDQLDERATYIDGRTLTLRDIVWDVLLHHLIHHRAQLVQLCRMAGGTPPGFYGPNREEMAAMIAQMQAAQAGKS